MSATKKQVTELENAVVILEERIEKMEEEHTLLKQMLTMQSTLIENLQMMLKMMSVSTSTTQQGYRIVQLGGENNNQHQDSYVEKQNDSDNNDYKSTEYKDQNETKNPSINKMKFRMSRVT
jgi:hypothetical protein